MPQAFDTMILVRGTDKTDSILSCHRHNGKCDIVYRSSDRVYSYSSTNVEILKLVEEIDPKSVVFRVNGQILTEIEKILCFGAYYRVITADYTPHAYHKSEVEITKNCLSDSRNQSLFHYFKETACALSLEPADGVNILEKQYSKITTVEDTTVLAKFLDPGNTVLSRNDNRDLIYPFGLNQSQKKAVENAFSSQISIIQGPPDTGKTQTILNILANAVMKGKTVAVVSNNNSATYNVAEKMEKQGLSFITAFLGSSDNKERFLLSQTGTYPNMGIWTLPRDYRDKLSTEIQQLSTELDEMLNFKNRIAQIEQELLALKPEQFYFGQYYESRGEAKIAAAQISKLSSEKLLSLWLEYEHSIGKQPGFFRRLLLALRFNRAAPSVFKSLPEETIPFLQNLFYQAKLRELQEESRLLKNKLKNYRFDIKMEELRAKSMMLFRGELAQRYGKTMTRPIFEKKDFRNSSDAFTKEYPVILSTTYSIKGTLSTQYLYDYVIVDEASQVDLATGVLAFSCAKNIIIVGDQKQLPNVLTPKDIQKADAIWNLCQFDERYHFATHSMLASATEVWSNAPSVLLREHYRCHPKIATFFNQKFYNGDLIVMTEDLGEENVLAMYRTAPGNHARGHMNQRQIDVIRNEVLPSLLKQGHTDIGIIAPYCKQVEAMQKQLGETYDVATVHKFQGREKDAIILSSVDNIIGEFVDDPNMLNVAVSRAVKSLSVVVSSDKENEKTNYGDLAKYIRYNNCQIVDSKVFSVFDLLYKEYNTKRKQYLQNHNRISEYDSENLAYSVIEGILLIPQFSKIDCVTHSSLSTLVKDYALLTEAEARYAANPMTHIDFLLFNKMDKSPVMAIEIDGTSFHAEGSRQAERDAMKNCILEKCGIPLLRIRTNESDETTRIFTMLEKYA